MANPQVENGHIRIANELWDATAKIRIPGEARQVLSIVIRKTWGWGKKKGSISLAEFIKGTGLSKSAIIKARRKLLKMNLINVTQKVNVKHHIYEFIKDYSKWVPLPKKKTVTQKVNNRDPKSKRVVPKKKTIGTQKVNQKQLEALPIKGSGSPKYNKDTSLKTKEKTMARFNIFIKIYPLKVKKADAKKAWGQLFIKGFASKRDKTKYYCELTDQLYRSILQSVLDQIKEKELKKWSPEWAYPASWLRDFRWDDEVDLNIKKGRDPWEGLE